MSTLVAFYVDQIENLTTDDLLNQKGVTARRADGATISYPQGHALYQDVLELGGQSQDFNIESSAIYSYVDIDPFLRIHSIDIQNPWLSDFADPSKVQEGSYPDQQNEVLVPEGGFQTRNVTVGSQTYELQSLLSPGQELDFRNDAQENINLEVSGTFDIGKYGIDNDDDQLWLFMDDATFEDLVEFFGLSMEEDVHVYMMSFIVEGMILTPDTYRSVDDLNTAVEELIENEEKYGDFNDVPDSLPASQTIEESETILVTLGFVVIGGVILSTLFAYLISRFRRREIAILKAMGYSHASVRTSLFAEILTTSFLGFFFGLGLAQILLVVGILGGEQIEGVEGLNFNNTIRPRAVGVAFLIMVVIALPGMFLASRRILSVSPAEAFRDN